MKKKTKFRDSLQHEESKIIYDILMEFMEEIALLKLKIALGNQYEIQKHNFQNK